MTSRTIVAAAFCALAANCIAFGQSQTASGTAVTVTVNDAVVRALSNQPLIEQAQAAVEAARDRVGEAESAYYPNVSATGSYNRIEPSQAISFSSFLPSTSGLPPAEAAALAPLLSLFSSAPSLSLFPVDNWDFHVGVNQVIFQFGKRGIQVQLAKSGAAAASIGLDQIRLSVAYQTAQGFYSTLFLSEQLAALDEQLSNLGQHLDATRARTGAGAATRYDELTTEVRVSSLQAQRIEAENQYEKQVIGLKQLLGLGDGTDLRLSGEFAPFPAPSDTADTQIAAAMRHRPEVLQAQEAQNAAKAATQLALLGAAPTISAHGDVGYKTGVLPNIGSLSFNWVAGVQINAPLFQGFLVAKQREEANAKLQAAQDNTASVERNVAMQVLQALADVGSARKQAAVAQALLDESTQMADVVKVQFDLGILTNLEYLDAQAQLERARLGELQARFREVLSEYALKQATGDSTWVPNGMSAAGG